MLLLLQVFLPSAAYLSADPLPTGRQAVPTEGGAGRNAEATLFMELMTP